MEGILKQQCVDSDGLYNWQRKMFVVDEEGYLQISSLSQSTTDIIRVPLSGAKYAKEWSFSSALSGFGFDIYWASDEVWSFLVDDEESCLNWVAAINNGIKQGVIVGDAPKLDRSAVTKADDYEFNEQEEEVRRTIERHHQFLSSSAGLYDRPVTESKSPHKDHASKRSQEDAQTAYFEDSNIDLKTLKSLNPTLSSQARSSRTSRYQNEEIYHERDEQESQPDIMKQSLPSSILSGLNDTHHYLDQSQQPQPPSQPSQYPPSASRGGSLNHNEHMDYYRSNITKALFETTGPLPAAPLSGTNHIQQRGTLAPPVVANSTSKAGIRTDEERNEYIESMKSIFATTKRTLNDTEHELQSLRASNPNPDHLSLQIRCQHLEQTLQTKERELEQTQVASFNSKLEFENRIKAMNGELDTLKQREHDLLSKFKQEIDHRVLRASNENSSYFEATAKALKAQHQRELRLLQEELDNERKNSVISVEKEISLRKRAEHSEQSLRKELNSASDRITSLEIELQRLQNTTDSTQSSWQREKTRLIAEYSHQIQQLTEEKERIEHEAQRTLQAKLQEANKKWEFSLQTVKTHESDLQRQQWESDHARSLIELQKKCQRDIEAVRTEERTLAAQEIQNLRSAFMHREHQTAEDLIELEKLHAKRIQQLEHQYQSEKQCNEELKHRLNDMLLEQERARQDAFHKSDHALRKTHEVTLQADHWKREVKTLQDSLTESKANENQLREQLRQVSVELRLLQAERGELQRQSTNHAAEVMQWKHVVHEQEKNYASVETETRVVKEEVAFLEHENQRLRAENNRLRQEMERADRLIYGVGQHVVDSKRTFPLKLESKFHDTTLTSESPLLASNHHHTSRSTPAAHHNSHIASSAAKTTAMKGKSSSTSPKTSPTSLQQHYGSAAIRHTQPQQQTRSASTSAHKRLL